MHCKSTRRRRRLGSDMSTGCFLRLSSAEWSISRGGGAAVIVEIPSSAASNNNEVALWETFFILPEPLPLLPSPLPPPPVLSTHRAEQKTQRTRHEHTIAATAADVILNSLYIHIDTSGVPVLWEPKCSNQATKDAKEDLPRIGFHEMGLLENICIQIALRIVFNSPAAPLPQTTDRPVPYKWW